MDLPRPLTEESWKTILNYALELRKSITNDDFIETFVMSYFALTTAEYGELRVRFQKSIKQLTGAVPKPVFQTVHHHTASTMLAMMGGKRPNAGRLAEIFSAVQQAYGLTQQNIRAVWKTTHAEAYAKVIAILDNPLPEKDAQR